jgi:hypothetical protein
MMVCTDLPWGNEHANIKIVRNDLPFVDDNAPADPSVVEPEAETTDYEDAPDYPRGADEQDEAEAGNERIAEPSSHNKSSKLPNANTPLSTPPNPKARTGKIKGNAKTSPAWMLGKKRVARPSTPANSGKLAPTTLYIVRNYADACIGSGSRKGRANKKAKIPAKSNNTISVTLPSRDKGSAKEVIDLVSGSSTSQSDGDEPDVQSALLAEERFRQRQAEVLAIGTNKFKK